MPTAKLTVHHNKQAKAYTIGDASLSLGRLAENDICIPADSLSRRHARISCINGTFELKDMGSSNGMTYQDKRVTSLQLTGDMQFLLGDVPCQFSLTSNVKAPAKTPASVREPKVKTLAPGDEVAGYRIEEVISRDRIQTTYRAFQTSMDRVVALKLLNPKHTDNRDFVKKFTEQAQVAGQLNHPSITHILDCNEVDGYFFYTMEWVEGESLSNILEEKRRIPPSEALPIAIQITEALSHIHGRNLLHKDIKPEVIIIKESKEVKLGGMGINGLFDQDQRFKGRQLIGTPRYMSPEQASSKILTSKSDIYNLGCNLFEMLSGRPVFDAESPIAIITQHLKKQPAPLSQYDMTIPDELNDIVIEMLAKDPNLRPTTEKLLQLFPSILKELELKKPKVSPKRIAKPKARKRLQPRQRRSSSNSSALTYVAVGVSVLLAMLIIVSQLKKTPATIKSSDSRIKNPTRNTTPTSKRPKQTKHLPDPSYGAQTAKDWGIWGNVYGNWAQGNGKIIHRERRAGALISKKHLSANELDASLRLSGAPELCIVRLGGERHNYIRLTITPEMLTLDSDVRKQRKSEKKRIKLPTDSPIALSVKNVNNKIRVEVNGMKVFDEMIGGIGFISGKVTLIVQGNISISKEKL